MAMLTEFGKELRKLRIDLEVSLKQLAEKLDVSSAYLSGIETGRKPVNALILNNIKAALNLNEQQLNQLVNAASKSMNEVVIRPTDVSRAELALMFARKVDSPQLDVQKLRKFLLEE